MNFDCKFNIIEQVLKASASICWLMKFYSWKYAIWHILYQTYEKHTARKTIFPKSWNIMKSSKVPRKYQLSIKLLDTKKTYLWKVQNKNFSVLKKHGIPYWRKYHLTLTFRIKRRPYFPSSTSSKQEIFRIQKTCYSMLKKISSYINFLNQKKSVFPISEKFKTRTSS